VIYARFMSDRRTFGGIISYSPETFQLEIQHPKYTGAAMICLLSSANGYYATHTHPNKQGVVFFFFCSQKVNSFVD